MATAEAAAEAGRQKTGAAAEGDKDGGRAMQSDDQAEAEKAGKMMDR